MLDQVFYNSLIKKYVIYFGSLFKNIYIERTDSSNNVYQTIAVPLIYAPGNKLIERDEQFANLSDRELAIKLPRMSFEMLSMGYDRERKLNSLDKILSSNRLQNVYNPVPYNITFTLSVYTKTLEDSTKIVEQILPFFAPEWTDSINLLPGFPPIDIPIVLQNATLRDTFEGQMTDTRYIIWTLGFTMKAYFFKSVQTSKLIKNITVNLLSSIDAYTQVLNINSSSNNFIIGEQIYQTTTNTSTNSAVGVITSANSSVLDISVQEGLFAASNTQLVYGTLSGAAALVSNTTSNKAIDTTINITPGQTANGLPTSNSSLTVPYANVNPAESYNYITTVTESV